MTADIIARAVLVAGAFLLVVGPGMQARLEMQEYHDLLATLTESDLPQATSEYLSLLAVGPSMVLRSPLGALEFLLTGPSDWYPRYRVARRAFRETEAAADERVIEIRKHLAKARNWAIVVLGSVLILGGSTIELLRAISAGNLQ
jgi:hypothetical protein